MSLIIKNERAKLIDIWTFPDPPAPWPADADPAEIAEAEMLRDFLEEDYDREYGPPRVLARTPLLFKHGDKVEVMWGVRNDGEGRMEFVGTIVEKLPGGSVTG